MKVSWTNAKLWRECFQSTLWFHRFNYRVDKPPAQTTGDYGQTGFPGRRGMIGDSGIRGYDGYPGPKGERGETGSEGSRGKLGREGKRGAPGMKGFKGAPGFGGYAGSKGFKVDWVNILLVKLGLIFIVPSFYSDVK